MTEFLSKASNNTDFHIYIIEQTNDNRKFNRGKLLNIGYIIAKKDGCNIFIFHDVDLLPSDDLLEYYTTMPTENSPIHIAKLWKNRYADNDKYFGGIVVFSEDQFKKINGFPNNFWGWGGEDDELLNRIKAVKMIPTAPKHGTITDLENMNLEEKLNVLRKHCDWKCNIKRELLNEHNDTWQKNGLSDLSYRIIQEDYYENLTIIQVNLGLNSNHWSNDCSGIDASDKKEPCKSSLEKHGISVKGKKGGRTHKKSNGQEKTKTKKYIKK